MSGPRLVLTPAMRQFLDYPKFGGQIRVLILGTEYFFDQSWQRAAESLGWRARVIASAMVGGLSREQIQQFFVAMAEFKPDFVLTSNYAGMDIAGIFSRFFEDARIPYVSWFTDTPRMILFGRQMHFSEYSIAATWERGYIPHLRQMGFQHVHWMPLATDPTLFNAPPKQTHRRQLSFVGTSMRQQAAEAIEKHAALPQVLASVAQALDEGKLTRERFIQGLGSIFDESLLAPLDDTQRRNLELLVNYEATRRQREELVLGLADLDLEVRGDAAWGSVYPKVQGQVGYFDELAGYYGDTAINLNSTSLQMPFAVNQRVFDCPAAGGFLITDHQADLHELFDEDEFVAYDTLHELRDKIKHYLANPREREQITLRAQRRILNEHTHAHRLAHLERFLRELY